MYKKLVGNRCKIVHRDLKNSKEYVFNPKDLIKAPVLINQGRVQEFDSKYQKVVIHDEIKNKPRYIDVNLIVRVDVL